MEHNSHVQLTAYCAAQYMQYDRLSYCAYCAAQYMQYDRLSVSVWPRHLLQQPDHLREPGIVRDGTVRVALHIVRLVFQCHLPRILAATVKYSLYVPFDMLCRFRMLSAVLHGLLRAFSRLSYGTV